MHIPTTRLKHHVLILLLPRLFGQAIWNHTKWSTADDKVSSTYRNPKLPTPISLEGGLIGKDPFEPGVHLVLWSMVSERPPDQHPPQSVQFGVTRP
ncbi:hypothetical protein L228DRAFT_243220 [Xylona heveae TC161]|uniref:Secreted protein n=1 Tax=Xylona heveae (strain CBS 132557 / TC161) TaxID=1328760 RepID=A0A165JWQ6_XYLHT|nr:hypothetical protein L228DRAFT_243220 [Xylona heveae TC161]KZF26719.1 hypothetical protein L228DRAFT_243220 [Xylona heveae TC161]